MLWLCFLLSSSVLYTSLVTSRKLGISNMLDVSLIADLRVTVVLLVVVVMNGIFTNQVMSIDLSSTSSSSDSCFFEVCTSGFRTKEDYDGNEVDADDSQEDTTDGGIVCNRSWSSWGSHRADAIDTLGVGDLNVLTSDGLDLSRGRRDHVTELVSQSSPGSSEGGRGNLLQVDWNNTPSSLNTELNEERSQAKDAKGVGQDPSWDQGTADGDKEDNGQSSSEILREVTSDQSTSNGTTVSGNGSLRSLDTGGSRSQSSQLDLLDHRRVQVLRRVREEVETSHEQDTVDADLPLTLEHVLERFTKGLGLGGTVRTLFGFLSLVSKEEFRFGQDGSEAGSKEGKTSTEVEEDSPVVGSNHPRAQVDRSGQEVAKGVTLLEDTRVETSRSGRHVLQGSGSTHTPDTTHTDTKETSNSQEARVVGDETSSEGQDGNDEQVSYHWPLSTKSIREETKEDGSKGSEE